jgi:hypothetical protein
MCRILSLRILLTVFALTLSAAVGQVSDAQSRTLPAQYRQSAERVYLQKLRTRMQTIRPRAQVALSRPARSVVRSTAQATTARTALQHAQLQRRIKNAGNQTQPRLYHQTAVRQSAYQRGNYNRNIRLRSRTITNVPPARTLRSYNRSLSTYAR